MNCLLIPLLQVSVMNRLNDCIIGIISATGMIISLLLLILGPNPPGLIMA